MTRNVVRATLLALIGGVLALFALASPASGASAGLFERDGDPVVVVANGPAVVEAGRTIDDLWIGNGLAIVRGRVEGSIVVADGKATIARGGFVEGDITVLRGSVDLRPDSVVRGDVQASKAIAVDDAAFIGGTVTERSTLDAVRTAPAALRSAMWLLLTVALLAIGLGLTLGFRPTADRVAATARDWPLRSSLWGTATTVMVPIVAALAVLSVVGGLLAVLLIGALGIALVLGLVTTALVIGRMIVSDRARAVTAFLIGLAIIRLAAWLPGLFELVTIPAAVFGLGGLLVALREGRAVDTDQSRPDPIAAEPRLHEEEMATADISAWLDEPDHELFDEAIDLRPPAPSVAAEVASAPVDSPRVFTTTPAPQDSGPEVNASPAAPTPVVTAADPVQDGSAESTGDRGDWLSGLMAQAGSRRASDVVDLRPEPANGPGHRAVPPSGSEPGANSAARRGRTLFDPEPAPPHQSEPVVVASVPVRPAPVDLDRRESDRITEAGSAGIRSWRTS